MKFLWSRLQRDVRIWVNTMFILISLKTEIARSVNGPKLQGPHAEDAMAKPYLEPQIFGSRRIRAKTKLHKKPREACKSSWNPRGNQKSFTLTIPWNSAKLVKIFPGIIVRQHHTDRRLVVLRREQCAE